MAYHERADVSFDHNLELFNTWIYKPYKSTAFQFMVRCSANFIIVNIRNNDHGWTPGVIFVVLCTQVQAQSWCLYHYYRDIDGQQ